VRANWIFYKYHSLIAAFDCGQKSQIPSSGIPFSIFWHMHACNPCGTGDAVSDDVNFAPWLLQENIPPLVHDIAVISVAPNVAHQYPGRIVNITVVVKNNGNIYETFNVTVYRNTTAIGTILVTDLGIGENTTLIFLWDTTGLTPCNRWTISAKAPIVGDVNPSDNNMTDGTVKIKMIGNVNADGIIDIFDITTAAISFGATPSDPNWNPQVDLFQDGIIDIFDLVTIAIVFGNTCP
jgi:hypothetical protein